MPAKEKITCNLCPHHCALADGQTGRCRTRMARDGKLVSLSYGRHTSIALDPVEKKPFSRWQSGKYIVSVGSFGCNLGCPFCQNHSISQADDQAPTHQLSPAALVDIAVEQKKYGNIGLAFTYNEPFLSYEYILDTAKIAKPAGLSLALVTNGYVEKEPLMKILPFIDAMNIDLKSWREEFYLWLGGHIAPVKETISLAARSCHVEVTTLILPQKNDSEDDMDEEAHWLSTISPDLPLHISRYFPRYRTEDIPATPVKTINRLVNIARRHLKYVYAGNC